MIPVGPGSSGGSEKEPFGWGKTVGQLRKTMLRGLARVGAQFTLNMAAYNLARLPRLLAA